MPAWAQITIGILTVLPALIAAIGTIWNTKRINVVITQTNGMLAHLEKQAGEAGHAAGVADEKAAEKARTD